MPLYIIPFAIWRKRWNGRKCRQPLETKLAQHYRGYDTRDMWNVDEIGLLWKGVPNRNFGTTRRKVQNKQAGQGKTYHCSSLFNNW